MKQIELALELSKEYPEYTIVFLFSSIVLITWGIFKYSRDSLYNMKKDKLAFLHKFQVILNSPKENIYLIEQLVQFVSGQALNFEEIIFLFKSVLPHLEIRN